MPQGGDITKRFRKALYWAIAVALAFHVLFQVSVFVGLLGLIDFPIVMWGASAFALASALYLIGTQHTLVFFGLGASIGYAAEQLGVSTGVIFGVYRYTDLLGPKLGYVPIVIVFCWFMIVFLSHIVANLLIAHIPLFRSHGIRRFVLAIVTAMVATAYDLALDPSMSSETIRAWVWFDGGKYLGVPFTNYGGWMATAFAISYLYRSYEFHQPHHPHHNLEDLGLQLQQQQVIWAVVSVYGMLGLFFVMAGTPSATQLIAFIVIGIPTIAAFANLILWERHSNGA